MTALRKQATEILDEIPDDKFTIVIEVLSGLRALYCRSGKALEHHDAADSAMGIFNKYANPDLVHLEKSAWGEAAKEKHDAH
jgi:hypothetical protein